MAATLVNTAVSGTNGQSAGTSVVTPATSHTAGNALIVKVTGQEWEFSGGTVSVSNTAGDTFTAGTLLNDAGGGSGVQMFYCASSAGHASDVVTVTWSVSQRYKVHTVEQWSGLDSSGFLITQDTQEESGGGATITSSNLVTSTDSVLTYAVCASNDRSFTAGGGSTENYDVNTATGTMSHQSAYRIQSGAGTYTCASTANSASNFVMAAFALKVLAGGGGGSTAARRLTLLGVG